MRKKKLHTALPFDNYRVLNFVLLGSKAGKYGGPFETSTSQVKLTSEQPSFLFSGYFEDDAPNSIVPSLFVKVRHLWRLDNFFDVGSIKMSYWSWKLVKGKITHISFGRGITPFLITFFSIMRKSKTIIQTHGMLSSRTSVAIRTVDSLFTKPLARRCQAIVALTEIEKQLLSDWCPELGNKIVIIPNPSQASAASSNQPEAKTALFAARLHHRKRPNDFGSAAKLAAAKNYSESYFMLGPDEGELLQVKSITKGLDNFSYLGATDSKGALNLIEKYSIFVLASENEPWGNALVSALVFGRPVVLTESSHLSYLIRKYEAGIVVPDNDPEAICLAIHDIADESNYAKYAGNAIRLSKEVFSQTTVKQKLEALYANIQEVNDRSSK